MTKAKTDTVAVGRCPEHGVIYGDDLEYRFPAGNKCYCGRIVQRTRIIKRSRFEKLKS